MNDEFTQEINWRIKQNGVGFQIEQRQIIRVDDQFLHAKVVKPVIGLLSSDKANETALADFLKAHEHHRHDNNKDAVVTANRAFEAHSRRFARSEKVALWQRRGASDLIKIVRQNGLFPDYLDKTFDTYVAMMKSGLPDDAEAPSYLVAYAVHLSATNIIMAIEAEKAVR
jgi:hypothetical protein